MPYKIRSVQKKQTTAAKVEALKTRYKAVTAPASKRPRLTVSVIAILVITLIAAPAYLFFKRQSETKAWDLERQASTLVYEKQTPLSDADKKDPSKKEGQPALRESQTDRWLKAAKLYDEVNDRYAGSQAATIAQYNGGNVYFDLEKYDLAEKRYLSFLKKETDRSDLIPLVHLRLAYLYEKKKDNAKALDHLRLAYEAEGGRSQGQAGFEKGSLLEKMGNKKDAIVAYKEVSAKLTDSPWSTEAKTRLALLEPASATSTPPTPMPEFGMERQKMPGIPPSLPPGMIMQPKSPPTLPTLPTNVKRQIPPMPTAAVPTMPKVVTEKTPVPPVAKPIVPAVPAALIVPETAPAATVPSSAPIPLVITPEQLKMLREKGTLSIPLPPSAVSTEPALPVTQKEPEPAKPTEAPKPDVVVAPTQ
ncbi:MAG: tetratricopeptide repeat protein [Nitrospirota bacterium]